MQVNSSATSQNLLEVSRRLSENQPDVAAECLKCLIKSSTQEASSLQDAYNLLLSIYKKNIQLLVIEPKDDPLSLLKFCKYVVNRQEAPLGHLLLVQIAKLWDQSMMVIPEKNQLLGPTISLYQFRLSLRFNFVDPSVQKSNLDFLKKIPPTLLTAKQRVSVNFYKELLISDFHSIESLLKQAPNPQKRALLLYKKAYLQLEHAKNLNHSVDISQSYIQSAKLICDQLLCGNEINEVIKFKIQLLLLTLYYENAKNQDFSFSIEEIKGLFHQIVSSSLAHPSECRRAKFHYAYILVHLDSFLLRSEGFNLMRALLKDLSSNLNENSPLTVYIKKYVYTLFARTSPVELYSYGIPFKEALQAYNQNINLEVAQYHVAELYCYGDHEVPGNPSLAKKIFNRLKRSKNNKISNSSALKELEVTFCLMQNHLKMHTPPMLEDLNTLRTYYRIICIAMDSRKKSQKSILKQILDITKDYINNPSIRIYGLLTLAEFVAKEDVQLTDESLDELIASIKNELDLTTSEGAQGNTLEHTPMRAYFLLAELKRRRAPDEALDYYRRVYQHPLCLHRHKLIATFYVAQSLDSSNPEKYVYFFLLSLKKDIFPKVIEREIENFMKRFPLEDVALIEQIIERLLDKDSDCLRFGLSLAFSLYKRNHHTPFEKSLLKYISELEMHIYYQILLDRREINAALLKDISLHKLIELIIQPCVYEEEKVKCRLIMKKLIQLNFLETPQPNDFNNSVTPLDAKINIPLFIDFLKKIYEAHSTLTSESDVLLTKKIMQILLKTNSLKKITEEEPDLISLPEENPIIIEEDLQQPASAHQSFDSDRETSPHSLSFVLNSSEEETLDDFDWQNMSTIHTYPQEDYETLEPMQF